MAVLAGMPGALGQLSSPPTALSRGLMPQRSAVPLRTSPRPTVSSERVLALEAVSAQVRHTLGHGKYQALKN